MTVLNAPRLRYITRLDYERTHGWWVRFQRSTRETGRYHAAQKMFADRKHGSKAKALLAAMAWRDTQLGKYPPRREFGGHNERPPGSGYVKRAWRFRVERKTGKRVRYAVWRGWIVMHDGKYAESNYSIPKWGDAGAKLLITEWFSRKKREVKKQR